MELVNFLLYFIGVLNFFLAIFVFSRNPKSFLHRIFSLFILNATFWAISIAQFRSASSINIAYFWAKIIYSCAIFMPPLFLYFSLFFPQEKKKINLGVNFFCFFSVIFLLIVLFFTPLWIGEVVLDNFGNRVILRIGYWLWVGWYLFFILWSALNLVAKYKKAKGLVKTQLRYVFLAIAIPAFFGGIPFNTLLPGLGNYRFIWIGPILTSIMVILITYAIIRHRLMDIRLVVARTVSYTLLLFILALFYISAIFGFSLLFYPQPLNGNQLIVSVFLTLIAAFSFQPLRHFLEDITDTIFFKDRYDTEEVLAEITKIMSSTLFLEKLIDRVLEKLLLQMKIDKGAIVLWQTGRIKEIFSKNTDEDFKIKNKEAEVLLRSISQPVIYDELAEGLRKTILRKTGFNFSQVLKVKEKIIGLLLLGEKLSGDIYFNQDIELLKILSPQLAVAIQNALAYQEIQKFSETLKIEVQKATEDLRKTNQRLRQVSALKDEFVSLASHELRTPLTAIAGSLSTILEGYAGKIEPETRDFLEGAYNENLRLLRLVNNLLNISRIEAGRLKFEITVFNLKELIESVIENLVFYAREKNISLVFDCPDLMIKADQDKTREILINLVSNAIKFTEKGYVAVNAWKDQNLAVVAVEDTGKGILPIDKKKLFKKFSQLEEKKTSVKKGGTGLGLYICKNLIEKMEGEIWLESEYQKGTTFYFVLPLAQNIN